MYISQSRHAGHAFDLGRLSVHTLLSADRSKAQRVRMRSWDPPSRGAGVDGLPVMRTRSWRWAAACPRKSIHSCVSVRWRGIAEGKESLRESKSGGGGMGVLRRKGKAPLALSKEFQAENFSRLSRLFFFLLKNKVRKRIVFSPPELNRSTRRLFFISFFSLGPFGTRREPVT